MWLNLVVNLNVSFFQYKFLSHLKRIGKISDRRMHKRLSVEHEDAPVDIRISTTDGAEVAFGMTVVHWVESNLCEPLDDVTQTRTGSTSTIVGYSLTSALVSLLPMRYSLPSKIFSHQLSDWNTGLTTASYAACVLAKPALYTPSEV